MTAPDRIRATWYAYDDAEMPKSLSALTSASRFWDTDPNLVEYIRADLVDPAAIREAALREAAALMTIAAENCRKQFTYPPKTKEQRDYQTGAIIHSNAAAAILALIQKGAADDRA